MIAFSLQQAITIETFILLTRATFYCPRHSFGLSIAQFSGEKERLCLTNRFDIYGQNACGSYQNQRCAPAQSQEPPCGNSTGKVGCHYRLKRFREILAGFRYSLCRRATPLRREPLRLCAAVPRSDGEAKRGFYPGAFSGDCHRAA